MAAVGDSPKSALTAVGQEAGTMRFEEPDYASSNWYFTRDEIEKNSPSRKDGIDSKKESYFRRSYCTFCQDVGMRLKVPQLTIATAIVFCHRFFLRQSHRSNDRFMIATICMFLAGKVEETPRPLRDVILVSYEVRHKKDPVALQKIKQKEVFEQQRELVLVGERLVLQTLGFDLNIHHPYKPLIAAVKKLGTAQSLLAQVAWNFVNDGLRTSLCLQFKPHHIAAGAIFLAAKFLKVKLPSEGDRTWWQEFGVTPKQLEEVSNQMLELYEQQGSSGAGGGESKSSDPGGAGPSRDAWKDRVVVGPASHSQQQQQLQQTQQYAYAQPPPPPPPPPPLLVPQQLVVAQKALPPQAREEVQHVRSPPRPRYKAVNGHDQQQPVEAKCSPLDGKSRRGCSPPPIARVQDNETEEAAREHRSPVGMCSPPAAVLPPVNNGNVNYVDNNNCQGAERRERSRSPLLQNGERVSPREKDAMRRRKPRRSDEDVVRRESDDGLMPEGSPQVTRAKRYGDAERATNLERVEAEEVGERGELFPEERGEVENRVGLEGQEEERKEREHNESEEEMWELIEQVEVIDGPKKSKSRKNADKRRVSAGGGKSKELLEMVSPRRHRVTGMEVKKDDEEEGEIEGKRRVEAAAAAAAAADDARKEKASPMIEPAEKQKVGDVEIREKVEDGELPTGGLLATKERRGGTASASDGSPSRLSPSNDCSGRSRDRGGSSYHVRQHDRGYYYGRDHYHRGHNSYGSGGASAGTVGVGLGGGGGGGGARDYRYRHADGGDRDRGDRHRHRDREWAVADVEDHRHKKGRYEH